MTSRELVTLGRPLGASLLLGALMLAALGIVGASWADLSSATAERDAKAELLARSVAASQRARATPAPPGADPFVHADTATLAAAAVDSGLRTMAAAAGLSLLSSRADIKPDEPGPSGADVGTLIEDQAVLEGQNEALQALLIGVETGKPALLIDDIAVEPAGQDGAASGDPQQPRLHVSLTLSAYWRPGQGLK